MKFSHSLQFNAVPEWSESYIAYSNLKKLIYALEREQVSLPSQRVDEETGLLDHQHQLSADERFRLSLNKDLDGIVSFYSPKEREIEETFKKLGSEYENYVLEYDLGKQGGNGDGLRDSAQFKKGNKNQLNYHYSTNGQDLPTSTASDHHVYMNDAADSEGNLSNPTISRAESTAIFKSEHSDSASQKDVSIGAPQNEEDDDDDDDDEEEEDTDNHHHLLVERYPSDIMAYENFVSLKRKITQLYISIHDLMSYVQLNWTGFSKILKKYDKTLGSSMREPYMRYVNEAYPFRSEIRDSLTKRLNKVAEWYAKLCCQGDTFVAIRRLRGHLREYVAWERNTIWREMIAIERRTEAARISGLQSVVAVVSDKDAYASKYIVIHTRFGDIKLRRFFLNTTFLTLAVIIMLFIAILNFPIIDNREQNNCMALLVLVSLLWATEAIPLFVTSFLVPFLTSFLRILRADDGSSLPGKESTKVIFGSMWNPTIVLLLGGFTIAGALSKYQIAKRLATSILAHAGQKPRNVLLMNMVVAMFASMWISNVAAPILCFSIIQPLLRNLPAESDFAKILLIGISLASNIGGMASPIASPQNIIALQNMDPSPGWGEWFAISIPVCTVSIFGVWFLLLFLSSSSERVVLAKIRPSRDKFTKTQWFISFVTISTIILWCLERRYDEIFGDMGVIALIPIIIFFGTGLLTKEDFNNFLWTVIILAMGGVALGKAVSSSGLLELIAINIGNAVSSLDTFRVLLVFSLLTLVVATFVSHMVAAMIVLPVIHEVGSRLTDPHPRIFVMACGLMCSIAMALPTSGFPNMTAIMMENEMGKRYLKVSDFLKAGIPATLISFVALLIVGTPIMRILGF
ncbi:membrane transporter [Schizosaccharomyces cryophilus OY26]|uniref:Membrane transporter n=1 Tax=Schizosaccharomyces cryophilus (strain OY26 / ATCC MYA-4695 / CBS 11777 / NBRC 106824 / NRRL Y48691) TaxID=653667 RepID=S9VWY5_SCHCR|nr:membrane transporter [Schizosaccharomyces cryophilus OY26]EPY50455.1 membrane transporter [Schizosaccharomyces cryophilus OY26]